MNKSTIKKLEIISYERRLDILDTIYNAKTGHTGGSLSSVDMIVALYYEAMNVRPSEPDWEDRDRFILSKGHSVEGYYTVLADLGFFPKEELKTFSRYKSRLIGHPTRKVPGIEMNTGALGHGLPVSVGMAIAGKMKKQEHYVYTIMGDGEQGEGSIYEAAMAAGHYKLDNLIAVIDRNGLQISGSTEKVMGLEPLRDKWEAFRWNVLECNGNDIGDFLEAIAKAQSVKGKPTMIIAHTTKGKGVSFMENNPKWHHGVPTDEQYKLAIKEIKQHLKDLK